jgi:hypothetical protein
MNDVLIFLLCIPASFLLVVVIWASVYIPNSWFWKLLLEKDPKELPKRLAEAFYRREIFNTGRATVFYDNNLEFGGEAALMIMDTDRCFQVQKIVIKDVCKFMGVKGKPMRKITIVYPGNYKVISIYKTRLEALYKSFVRISAYINMYKMMLEYPDGQLVPVPGTGEKD